MKNNKSIGWDWAIIVSEQQRRHLDVAALRNKYPDVAEEFETSTEFLTVRLNIIAPAPILKSVPAIKQGTTRGNSRRTSKNKSSANLQLDSVQE
jgi:hypothetical protein